MANDPRVKSFTKFQDTTVLDSGRVTETTDDEKRAFISAQKHAPDEMVVHKRMVHKGLVYTSKSYSLSKRRRDCFGKMSDGVYGEIQNIVSFPSEGGTEIAVLFKKLYTNASFSFITRLWVCVTYQTCKWKPFFASLSDFSRQVRAEMHSFKNG